MKSIAVVLTCLLPLAACAIGAAGDMEWPQGANITVSLKVSAVTGTNRQPTVSGELLIKNATDMPLTIQDPHNRLAIAFLVFDPLGNPVPPVLRGKADPMFLTHSLAPKTSFTHTFEGLDFITGSAWLSYDLAPGKTYRVLAVYRPAGPKGPGFATQQTKIEIPK